MIYFITGGERSGKSRYAQQLALKLSERPVYLATARNWDTNFQNRISRHQSERDDRWLNIERDITISEVDLTDQVIVLDCITLWLTNIFMDKKYEVDESLTFARKELSNALATSNTWIIISNEIGMGVHANTEVGRKFVELQGWINQILAEEADELYLMVSGIPVRIKPSDIKYEKV